MDDDVVIRVEGLSKKYLLGQRAGAAGGLRHAIEDGIAAPFRWAKRIASGAKAPRARPEDKEFWALRDVTFDVRRGQVVGIIGRNGAGKSTLLKVLSRITDPTAGKIGLKGRVASLLEVGTGFHQELSGRENVFLNGAVLGMRQAEVRQKFDEIVAFAGVEKFLDTPVKRYSSGMYVRLAFAVAAHLEPEILIVDEVLAVGDSEFQKKCLGKMEEISTGGRTVLFVSHNLAAVGLLCSRGIYLKGGRVESGGEIAGVLARYREDFSSDNKPDVHAGHRRGSGSHRIVHVEAEREPARAREPLRLKIQIRQIRDEGPFHLALHFRDEWDTEIFSVDTAYLEKGLLSPGDQTLDMTIESPWLFPSRYRIEAFLHLGGIIDHWPDACRFEVDGDVAKRGYSLDSAKNQAQALASFQVASKPGLPPGS